MKRVCAAVAATSFFLSSIAVAAPSPTLSQAARADLHWLAQEIEIAHLLDTVRDRARRGPIAIRNVTVVDAINATVHLHQTVITGDGRISWVGDAANAPDSTGAFSMDGTGLYLAPGLADMHVHTASLAEQLLRLSVGNTSVRDMDGFPWMLELRRAIASGRLLAPNEYIAGTIIASAPLDGYAVVVGKPDEAREVVRKEAACGYDFVKVHNLLPQPVFDSVTDEARRAGMDVVGHIPHDISIDHAVHAGGMRTLEHLKGFINDETLMVSDEDYAAALGGAEVWLTPTFYTIWSFSRMAGAADLLKGPEMKYVPLRRRAAWAAAGMSDHDRKIEQLFETAVPLAMKRLLPLNPHWLAGTDAAQYPLQVAGYAILDELDLMKQAGISRADVIRAATSEPAAAMGQSNTFGQIKRGMRADLVVLGANPLESVDGYRDNRGVMVRGLWLSRSVLDASLASLAKIEAEPDDNFAADDNSVRKIIYAVQRLTGEHIALDAMHLRKAEAVLNAQGDREAGGKLEAIAAGLEMGPCAEVTPSGGDD